MNAAILDTPSLAEQVATLLQTVAELRAENAALRQEVCELKCDVGYWKSRHADAVKTNVALQAKLDQSQAEIRQLKAERFGKQSEKQATSDRSNELVDPQAPPMPKRKRGQQPHRPAPKRRDISHLPAREDVLDLPDDAKVCACCGQPFAAHGEFDAGEQVEIETIVYRKVIRRKRYRRTCECPSQPTTISAPPPPKLLPKSILGTSLWVHLLLEKFHLQRPTQRTIEQLRMLGLPLAPGTITDGLRRLEPLFVPLYEAIRERHLQADHFHADETRWRVFTKILGKIGHGWWLWLFASDDTVLFVIDPTRSHQVPESHFAKITGDKVKVLTVDRYSAYKAMSQVKLGHLRLAFCWAHVRRDFVGVGKGFPELIPWALAWLGRIRELYRMNRERLRQELTSAEFLAGTAKLREHLDAMTSQREAELADAKLREPCCKALVSLQEHWSGLTLFVNDAHIPLDNNRGERLIRNPAVGRKNYYGSGSAWSARLAMMLFSLFATLLLWKVNPLTWLTWYFEACADNGGRVPQDAAAFMPWNLSPQRLAEMQTAATHPASDTS